MPTIRFYDQPEQPPLFVYFICLVVILAFFPAACLEKAVSREPFHNLRPDFHNLRQDLKKTGFEAEKIDQYYENENARFEADAVARYFHHKESRLNYDQFLTPKSVRRARQYMQKHRPWLKRAENNFQVEKEIITAILLVETRLGNVSGSAVTFNILSSLAALSDPALRKNLWNTISDETPLSKSRFREKATRKADWAYEELKAFLTYVDRENIADPLSITGSYAGAMGIPQFMPSNILSFGVDGDKDGRIDLFTHPDAILSVARYLKHYGWKPGISEAAAYRVLLHYNYSRYYAKTLLTLRKKLKES